MTKILPYLYIFIGVMIALATVLNLLQQPASYRIFLNYQTENVWLFGLVRGLFASWFLFDGIKRIKTRP
jgi:hypothetical protein